MPRLVLSKEIRLGLSSLVKQRWKFQNNAAQRDELNKKKLMAAEFAVSMAVIPCSPEGARRLGVIFHLHLQDIRLSLARNP
jgi:hypothetical protein